MKTVDEMVQGGGWKTLRYLFNGEGFSRFVVRAFGTRKWVQFGVSVPMGEARVRVLLHEEGEEHEEKKEHENEGEFWGVMAGRDSQEREPCLGALAEHLLRERLLLSALELHAELLERGCELPNLRDFFSNPGNFESLCAPPALTSRE